MSRYAVLPAGSDRNRPRLTDAQLTRLAAQSAPINGPYVSPHRHQIAGKILLALVDPVAYLAAGMRHADGVR